MEKAMNPSYLSAQYWDSMPRDAEHCGAPIGDEIVMNLDVFSPIREDYLHLVEYQANDF